MGYNIHFRGGILVNYSLLLDSHLLDLPQTDWHALRNTWIGLKRTQVLRLMKCHGNIIQLSVATSPVSIHTHKGMVAKSSVPG
jgi:hypothetical protein